jgi:ATP-dependent DNA helicase PIF1
LHRLESLNQPIALIKAVYNNMDARIAATDTAGGLPAEILIARGSRVMLLANISTKLGLVNGSLGTVVDIIYGTNERPPGLPFAVMVRFDNYAGPYLLEEERAFPVVPILREWEPKPSTKCQRTQIPLACAYAVTVHKVQGLTLDKIVLDLGREEFASGITFVALSRTKRLKDIAFAKAFAFDRLPQKGRFNALKAKVVEEARLERLAEPTVAEVDQPTDK